MEIAIRPEAPVAPPLPARWRVRLACDRGAAVADDNDAAREARPEDLIAAIAERGDRAAFATLFAIYAGRVKGMAMRAGASAEAAEDIAQETMLAIWRKASTYDSRRSTSAAWIFTIARNQRIDRLRRDTRSRLHLLYETVEPEGPQEPDAALDTVEREARVRRALEALPAEQVNVVRESFFEGRPHAEIAARLGLPLGTVKSRLRLAMARLRNSLRDLT